MWAWRPLFRVRVVFFATFPERFASRPRQTTKPFRKDLKNAANIRLWVVHSTKGVAREVRTADPQILSAAKSADFEFLLEFRPKIRVRQVVSVTAVGLSNLDPQSVM